MLNVMAGVPAQPVLGLPAPVFETKSDAVEAVRAVLSLPDDQLDYARAKLALDKIIDPSVDVDATLAELDRMAKKARRLAGLGATTDVKLAALRKLIYQSGPWNGHRPFGYDHTDFKNIRRKLIADYLETRLGNCISMPILLLILADKLGLDTALALAPVHMFVRYRRDDRQVINLETTSGAQPARDIWICESRNVSDLGIETGFYMRSLSRREGVAAMALTVIEHLTGQRRYDEAIATSEIVLQHAPSNGFGWAHIAYCYQLILRTQFLDQYRSSFLIPLALRPGYFSLLQRHLAADAAAKALGWEPA